MHGEGNLSASGQHVARIANGQAYQALRAGFEVSREKSFGGRIIVRFWLVVEFGGDRIWRRLSVLGGYQIERVDVDSTHRMAHVEDSERDKVGLDYKRGWILEDDLESDANEVAAWRRVERIAGTRANDCWRVRDLALAAEFGETREGCRYVERNASDRDVANNGSREHFINRSV